STPPLLHRSAHPRVPHAFPTRRSSDLDHRLTEVLRDLVPDGDTSYVAAPAAQVVATVAAGQERWTTVNLVGPEDCGGRDVVARRSEEHTSELQSQSKLVCGLLLEKKNA